MQPARISVLSLFIAFSLLAGCATPPPAGDAEALAEFQQTDDPMEPANRRLFAISETIDRNVTEPVAREYRDIVPRPVRSHIGQVFDNLANPVRLTNDMLQGRPRRAGDTLMRLLINTTLGVAGVFDVADGWGYPRHTSSFATTLGLWDVGPGPYLYVPLLGPADARSLAAYPAGIALSPFTYLPLPVAIQATNLGRSATAAVNDRAEQVDPVAATRRTALDPYASFRSQFRQQQQVLIEDAREDRRATVPAWFPPPAP